MPFKLANINGRSALVAGTHYFDVQKVSGGRIGPDPMSAVAHYQELSQIALENFLPDGSLEQTTIGPPVPYPSQIFGLGLNYRSHASEFNVSGPNFPLVFAKFPGALTGPMGEVKLRGDRVDWEVELVVVIGREAKNVSRDAAWEFVAGYTIGQDISDRTMQFRGEIPQFSLGKSFDTYAPTGPFLVSLDSLPNPGSLALSCDISGTRMQEADTSEMIFDVPYLIAYLSAVVTLRPGDLIFTGTPEGVGMATGRFLRDGDVIVSRIAGLGEMVNKCVNNDVCLSGL